MTTEQTYRGPVPMITPESAVYWEKTKQHELWMRHCNRCNKPYYYPRDICPMCGGRDVDWRQMSGRGTVFTYAIVHRSPNPALVAPFVTAIVELDEGAKMLTNIVIDNPTPDNVKVGMPVEVTFDDITSEISLPKFKPVR